MKKEILTSEAKGIENIKTASPKITGEVSQAKGLKVLQFQNPVASQFEKVVKENVQNARVFDIKKGADLTQLKSEPTTNPENLKLSKNEGASKADNLPLQKNDPVSKSESLPLQKNESASKAENVTTSRKELFSKINDFTFTKNTSSSKAENSSSANDARIFRPTLKTDSYTLKDIVNNKDFSSSLPEEKISKEESVATPVEKEIIGKKFANVIAEPTKEFNPAKETGKKSPELKFINLNHQKSESENPIMKEGDKVSGSDKHEDLKTDRKELFEKEIKIIRQSPLTVKNEIVTDKELLKMTGEKLETPEARIATPRASQHHENISASKVEINDSPVRETVENLREKEILAAREIEKDPKEILIDKTQERYRVHREAGEKTSNSKSAETETKSQANYSSEQEKSSHKENSHREQSHSGDLNESVHGIKTANFDKIEKSEFETLMNESSRIVKKGEIFKEISKFIVSQEKQSLTFKIEPEQLGKLKITLDMAEHSLKANIEVESEAIKSFIEKNISDLFNHLSKEGIQLNTVNISLFDKDNKQAKQPSSKRKDKESEVKEEKVENNRDGKVKMMGYNTRDYLV